MTHITFLLMCFAGDYPWPSYYEWPKVEVTATHRNSPQLTSKPTLTIFSASWCGPCKESRTAIEAAAKAGKLPFTPHWIDIDEHPEYRVKEVPIYRWSVSKTVFRSGIAEMRGWHGLDHLVTEFERTTKPVAKLTIRYSTRSSNWTGPDGVRQLASKSEAINHLLTHPEHGTRFVRDVLNRLSLDQLRAVHSDDHERRLKPFH